MLIKLLKHEFRATGRVMLPLYLILLAAALGANLSVRVLMDIDFWALNALGGLLLMAFVVAMGAVAVMSIVVMVRRFYKNLLQDEGYVMLTLPCSVHQHIWSKLIVSAVWFAATMAVMVLAGLVSASDVTVIGDLVRISRDVFRNVTAYYALNGTAIALELLAVCFLGSCLVCLHFYAALSIGHSFSTHKLAWSVGWYFLLQFAVQMFFGGLMALLDATGLWNWLGDVHILRTMQQSIGPMGAIHLTMLVVAVLLLVYGAVFYGLTAYFLKNKLNLE